MHRLDTLWDLLDLAADLDLPLRIHGEASASWITIRQQARALAAELIAGGCPVGARIIVGAHTSSTFLVGFFGAIGAGALPVPTAPEVGRRALVAVPERLDALERHLSPWGWFGFASPPDDHRRWLTTPALIAELPELRLSRPQDTAYLQLTSGTTTGSRATCVGHHQALANSAAAAHSARITGADRVATWLPLYHDYGLIGGVLMSIHHQTSLLLHPPTAVMADPTTWLADIAADRVTIVHSASFLLGHLLRRADRSRLPGIDLSHLRMFIHGGERLDAKAFREVQALLSELARLPANSVVGGYGLAEAGFCVSTGLADADRPIDVVAADPFESRGDVLPDPQGTYKFVSVGPPLRGIDARIQAPDGQTLPERRVGEIQLRGESITAGYWQDAAATAATFDGAWLRTGDLGYLADGHLYVTGRLKEIIILAGRNYLPQDLEEAIETVPGVRPGGSVALGVFTPDLGTETLVVLVEAAGDSDTLAVKGGVQQVLLSQFGVSAGRVILLRAGALPKTTSGKRQRTLCRQWVINDRLPAELLLPEGPART